MKCHIPSKKSALDFRALNLVLLQSTVCSPLIKGVVPKLNLAFHKLSMICLNVILKHMHISESSLIKMLF